MCEKAGVKFCIIFSASKDIEINEFTKQYYSIFSFIIVYSHILVEIEDPANVKFTLNREGELMNIKILKSSGSSLLDKAAINVLKKSEPFLPIPTQLNLKDSKVRFTIIFKID